MPYGMQTLQRATASGPSAPQNFTSASGQFNPPINFKPKKDEGKGGKGKGGKKKGGKLQQYLAGDVDYQNAINDLAKNFGAYRTQNLTNRGNLQQDFGDTKARLSREEDMKRRQMQEDFASRGIFGTGLYAGEENKFNLDYAQQQGDAQTSFNRNISQLLTDLANAQRLMQQQKADARLAALRRRAAQLGEF